MGANDLRLDDTTCVGDLAEAPSDRIEQAMAGLDIVIAKIKGDIDDARRRFAADGVPADLDWLRRAETALRLKKAARFAVQNLLGKAKRREKQAAHAAYLQTRTLTPEQLAFVNARRDARRITFGEVFVRLAERELPPDLFASLAAEARLVVAAQEGPAGNVAAPAGPPPEEAAFMHREAPGDVSGSAMPGR